MVREQYFSGREEASAAAADYLAEGLRLALEEGAQAQMVVCGGTTPGRCFDLLSEKNLDWSRVNIIPSDERWTEASSSDSNEKMIRERLMSGAAAEAGFIPLYYPELNAQAACEKVNQTLQGLPMPFATALLGMGTDGHFASLFPDAENLAEGLDVSNQRLCLPVYTKASPYPRISLSLSALSFSKRLILLFFGQEKKQVFDQARAGEHEYPVSALLRQNRVPVDLIWAD